MFGRDVRAVVQFNRVMDYIDVWLVRDTIGDGYEVATGVKEDHTPYWEKRREGMVSPIPLLRLTPKEVEALRNELLTIVPPNDATTAHLKDAQAVRDKLLALVEHTITTERG